MGEKLQELAPGNTVMVGNTSHTQASGGCRSGLRGGGVVVTHTLGGVRLKTQRQSRKFCPQSWQVQNTVPTLFLTFFGIP